MAVNPSNLVEIINSNKNKKLIASKIIESNPNIIPILPKLIKGTGINAEKDINSITANVNKAMFDSIFNKIKYLKNNNDNITKLFPDIELAIQILVSSILSPKKMTDVQLNYKLNKKLKISPTASSQILELIKTYITETYEIEDKLPEIIREALFKSGAYVTAVIPESSLDEVINSDLISNLSTESFKTNIDSMLNNYTRSNNILKLTNDNSATIDANCKDTDTLVRYLASESCMRITDNYNIFQYGKFKDTLKNKLISTAIKTNTSISTESLTKLEYIDIFRQKNSTTSNKQMEMIKTKDQTKRKSLSKPLVMRINTEATIPVFTSGDETNHIGYFILLDENGRPLSGDLNSESQRSINNTISGSTDQAQLSVSQKAYNNLIYDSAKGINTTQIFDLYKEIIEKQLYTTIKNSLYGSEVSIANKNDIYNIMFCRALSEQKTNILFIPSDLIVYYAFGYNEIGIGKSLLENLSILSSMRAILLFAKVMAYAKSSIDVTKVNISLDPNDPDPEKTIEQIQEGVLKLRQNYFPLGINNPTDLTDWIHRSGLQFAYDNHPGLPNVKIDFENSNLTHTVPNSDLDEDLRKQSIISLGLPPETIDNSFSPEFATTIVNSNVLLSKRVMVYQKSLLKHTDKFVKIIITNDEDLRNEIKTKLEELINELGDTLDEEDKALFTKDKDAFYSNFIDKLSEYVYTELPKPENTNLANLSAEYDVYKENLEKILESIISQEIISEDIAGELTNHIDTVKNTYKHHLLRKWMSENNFYPEAFDIADIGDENSDKMLEILSTHITSVMSNSTNLIDLLQKFKLAANKDLARVDGAGAESTMSTASSSSSDWGSGSSDDGSGGEGGDDKVTSDDDTSLDMGLGDEFKI